MKFNFTSKREVTLAPQRLKSGRWTAIVLSHGINKFVFNTTAPNQEGIMRLLARISDANCIDTKHWTKFN